MIKINKLDHIGIRVIDFARSIKFYEKLGFALTRNDSNEHVVVLKHKSGIEINLLDSGNNNNGNKNILMDMDDDQKYSGYTHIAINIESIAQTKKYLEDTIGVKITQGPVTFGDGKTSIFIRDPDRNVIEFTESPKELSGIYG